MSGTPTITPTPIGDGPRRRALASTRLLHEWSSLQAWESTPLYELRLGPTPLSAHAPTITPQIEAMLRVFNRYADMVGVTGDEIQVIEAKMIAEPGAVSQLQHYVDLVHTTPLISSWSGRRVQGVLLFAVDDPIVRQRANAYGIRVEIFTPTWAQEYLQKYYARRRRAIPSGGTPPSAA